MKNNILKPIKYVIYSTIIIIIYYIMKYFYFNSKKLIIKVRISNQIKNKHNFQPGRHYQTICFKIQVNEVRLYLSD